MLHVACITFTMRTAIKKVSKQKCISLLPPLANYIRIYYIFPPSSKMHLVTIQPDIVSRFRSAASGHGRGKQQCIRSLSSLQARQWWGQGDIFGFQRRGVKVPECDLQLPLRIQLGTAGPAEGFHSWNLLVYRRSPHAQNQTPDLHSVFISVIPHKEWKQGIPAFTANDRLKWIGVLV